MISWPNSLPQSLRVNGFVERPGDNLLKSENSVGPAKIRRKSTSSPSLLAGSMVLTPAQKTDFKSFVKSDISDCVKAFNFPDPDDGDALLVRLDPNYSFSQTGNNWILSLEFEVLP